MMYDCNYIFYRSLYWQYKRKTCIGIVIGHKSYRQLYNKEEKGRKRKKGVPLKQSVLVASLENKPSWMRQDGWGPRVHMDQNHIQLILGHISYRSNTYVVRPGDRPTRKRPQGWITRLKGHPKARRAAQAEKGPWVHLHALPGIEMNPRAFFPA